MHNRLTIAFREKGLTADDVARKLGISYQTMVSYTTARQPIKKSRAEAIDDLLERERGTTQVEHLKYIISKYDYPCEIVEVSK